MIYQQKNQEIYNNILSGLPNHQTKALLIGFTGKYISSWLHCGILNVDYFRLDQNEFVECLRLRLFIPTFVSITPTNCNVRSCNNCEISNSPFHALTCKGNSYWTNFRHDGIKNLLIPLIKKCRPLATVLPEKVVGINPDGSAVRTDILISEGSKVQHIDVTVKSPTSTAALSKKSYETSLIAAKLGEDLKRKTYGSLPAAIKNSLIPFSLEATGGFGPSALKFLKDLTSSQLNPNLSYYFLCNVSRIIAKTQARMIMNSRSSGIRSTFI
jgi:hypothetical protein